jgi:hypothetical protein
MTDYRTDTESKDLTPTETHVEGGGSLEKRSQSEAWDRLQQMVDDDPNTLAVPRRMSLVLQIRQLLNLAGHFPIGVSYYAIAAILSGVIWVSDTQIDNPAVLIGAIMTSALAGQIIEKVYKDR